MEVRMDGRVAAITGASTGLGLAMAKEFAASGASVAILARKADVLATAKAEVDILVNNAGISHAKPFETVTDEDWQGDLDLKLFAAIRTIRAVLPGMRERKWGR